MGAAYQRLLARLEQTRLLGVSLGLERMQAALAALGSPERALRAVHIAGTNGKGLTAAMTDSILRAGDLRTGLYTSPHLSRFTERIRIDGQEIDGDALGALDDRVVATGVALTYFEVATVLAFLAMAEAGVDVGVLEVGLGGRLDSTNVCVPLATAITSIGLDHTDLLGDSLAAIAAEKAGIAKPGVPLLLGRLPAEAEAAVARIAAQVGAPVSRAGADIPQAPVDAALRGRHQQENAALAVALARLAARACGRDLTEDAVTRGLAGVVWPGRLEQLAPDLWVDAAHNLEGVEALLAALPEPRPLALVASIVAGKPAAQMLAALAPRFDSVWLTRSRNPRALPPEQLARQLPPGAPPTAIEPDPVVALSRARAAVAPAGAVVVCGSVFLVGEVRAHILGEPTDPGSGSDPMPVPPT